MRLWIGSKASLALVTDNKNGCIVMTIRELKSTAAEVRKQGKVEYLEYFIRSLKTIAYMTGTLS